MMTASTLDTKVADMCRVLASPARVQILRLLANRDIYCGDLVQLLGLSQSTISHHLKALREAGFITGETEGPATCYKLNRQHMHDLHMLLSHLFSN